MTAKTGATTTRLMAAVIVPMTIHQLNPTSRAVGGIDRHNQRPCARSDDSASGAPAANWTSRIAASGVSAAADRPARTAVAERSEERRVGKGCRDGRAAAQ